MIIAHQVSGFAGKWANVYYTARVFLLSDAGPLSGAGQTGIMKISVNMRDNHHAYP
jgi:hypothetical protein